MIVDATLILLGFATAVWLGGHVVGCLMQRFAAELDTTRIG